MPRKYVRRTVDLHTLHQRDLKNWLRHAALEPLEQRRLLAAGQLDPTFGNGGHVISTPLTPHETVSAVAQQAEDFPAGRIGYGPEHSVASFVVRHFVNP